MTSTVLSGKRLPRAKQLLTSVASFLLVFLLLHNYVHARAQDIQISKQGHHGNDLTCIHAIQVIDSETKRGVPMVNLTTTNLISQYTDSNGVVAFWEPGYVNQVVWFTVAADGYVFHNEHELYFKDGVAIKTNCQQKTVIEITRTNIAERLYRVTGSGIYRDSVLTGEKVPSIPQELLETKFVMNTGVTGQDSVMTTVFRDKIYWFWGDTEHVSYPLGNFFVTGATSPLPGSQDYIDIEHGVNLSYFKATPDSPFVKPLARIPPDNLPTWIHNVVTLPKVGNPSEETIYAAYMKANHDMSTNQTGILEWNDEKQEFELVVIVDPDTQLVYPMSGHDLVSNNASDNYIYLGNPYPVIRVPKNQFTNISAYEAYTPLKYGTSARNMDRLEFDRNPDGTLRYSWKRNTAPLTATQLLTLVLKGHIPMRDAYWLQLHSPDGEQVICAAGDIAWNEYRQKYIMIAQQFAGKTSFIGEIWYSESDHFMGPWKTAVKVVSHHSLDFYNPKLHSSKLYSSSPNKIYFEGTYVATFDKGIKSAKYNYNQQMYSLNLDTVAKFFNK